MTLEKKHDFVLTTRFLVDLRYQLLRLQIKLSKHLNQESGRLFQ